MEILEGKSAFITFRPHPNDSQLFEDFLIIFLPMLKKKIQNYVYVVERDDTAEKHFHCLVNDKSFTETGKVKQKLNCKVLKKFNKFLSFNSETNLNVSMHTHFIGGEKKEKNTQYFIGYCYKENNVSRRDTNLPASYINSCLEYFNMIKRIDINDDESHRDVKYVKPNNIHRYVSDFKKFEGEEFTYQHIHRRMIKQGYSFNQLSSKQLNYSISEIKSMENEEEEEDMDIIDSHRFNQEIYTLRNTEMAEVYRDLKFLVEYTKTDGLNLSKSTKKFLLNYE